ncbi:MAG: hypothetical protein K9I68_04935 [Bacteroidales bacterium]|nr:hypothetical protein [Bacteroidales bacterium]MCF8337501.1 hypothetical protein [Bacteroidales bacterium]
MTKIVIIDTRTEEAKKIVEFLKSTNYAKVVDKEPNAETIQAMEEVEKGNVNSYQSVKELMSSLKKKNSVQD